MRLVRRQSDGGCTIWLCGTAQTLNLTPILRIIDCTGSLACRNRRVRVCKRVGKGPRLMECARAPLLGGLHIARLGIDVKTLCYLRSWHGVDMGGSIWVSHEVGRVWGGAVNDGGSPC